jgi:hypothetical protein
MRDIEAQHKILMKLGAKKAKENKHQTRRSSEPDIRSLFTPKKEAEVRKKAKGEKTITVMMTPVVGLNPAQVQGAANRTQVEFPHQLLKTPPLHHQHIRHNQREGYKPKEIRQKNRL